MNAVEITCPARHRSPRDRCGDTGCDRVPLELTEKGGGARGTVQAMWLHSNNDPRHTLFILLNATAALYRVMVGM
jgi:hypothetical protein